MSRAGEYRYPITIEKQSEKRDIYGQRENLWEKVIETRAAIRFLTGREYITNKTEVSTATLSVRIRQRQDVTITTAMRIRHDTAIYEIQAVLPGKVEIDLACITVKP